MSAARPNAPIKLKLLPDLAQRLPRAADRFGLSTSGLVAILVWNDHVRPDRRLEALPRSRTLVRAPVTISLRGPLHAIARRRARAQRMSVNAYLEALAAAHLPAERDALSVLPAGFG